jgi:hypothetical protein
MYVQTEHKRQVAKANYKERKHDQKGNVAAVSILT